MSFPALLGKKLSKTKSLWFSRFSGLKSSFPNENRKKFFSLLFTLILLISLAVTVNLVQERQLYEKRAIGENASLTLPTNLTANPGENFDVPIFVNTDNADISGVDVVLDFSGDKDKISLMNIQANAQTTTTLKTFAPVDANGNFDAAKVVNNANSTGKIEFGAVTFDWGTNTPSTAFNGVLGLANPLATLTFLVNSGISTPNQATISVIHSLGETTDSNIIDYSTASDILANANSLTVDIPGPATPTPEATGTPTPTPTPTLTPTPTPTPTPCSYKVCEGMACVTKEKNPPCPSDTCANDSDCSCSYKVCVGASCVTKTQVPPCPTDACLADTDCAIPKAQLTFKIKFQGISIQSANKTVSVILKQADQEKYRFDSLGVSSDASGVYSGTVTNIDPGTYDIYIKGWAHLQKKFSSITLIEGENLYDWSSFAMIVGDVTGDNLIAMADITAVISVWIESETPVTTAIQKYDLTEDGVIALSDITAIIANWISSEVGGE